MPVNHTVAPARGLMRALTAALTLAAIAVAIAGCGSSETNGTNADPATVVPATASLYAGAIVRPDGPLKASARAAGQALTHQANPYLRLLGALQTPSSPALDYKDDVEPWLGPNAGAFLNTASGSGEADIDRLLSLLQQGLLGGSSKTSTFPYGATGVQGAIVLDTSDSEEAGSFLDSQAKHAGAHASAYRGVSFQVTSGGVALGVVGHFAVIGSESGLHGVIDTTKGGPALVHATAYSKLLASAPSGVLAHVYSNVAGPSPGARAPEPRGAAGLLSLLAGNRPVNVSLVPSANSIALDADALSSGSAPESGGLLSASAEASRALGELPGESWFAVGLANAGTTLGADTQGLEGLASLGDSLTGSGSAEASSSATLSVNGLLEGFLAPLRALGSGGAEAKRDFASWMGSAGIFASGSGLLELQGGVVIASKDPARSRAAVSKLSAKLRERGGSVEKASVPGTEAAAEARISGLPVVLFIAAGRAANGQSKFVMGLGEESVKTALNPSSTLSGSAAYGTASAALGEGIQPSLTIDFPTLLSLLEGVGLNEDPTISPFVPYLRSLTTLAGGGKNLGEDIERFRLVLTLVPASG
jgi:hypothetical protein